MTIRGSTIVPWLLLGPLFGAIAAKLVHDLTGWPAARLAAQVLLGVTLLVILTGVTFGLVDARRRERERAAVPGDGAEDVDREGQGPAGAPAAGLGRARDGATGDAAEGGARDAARGGDPDASAPDAVSRRRGPAR